MCRWGSTAQHWQTTGSIVDRWAAASVCNHLEKVSPYCTEHILNSQNSGNHCNAFKCAAPCRCLPLQSVVSGVTTAYNREQLWLANESLITKLQARCRGYMVRKNQRERMEYLKSNEPAATNIQVRRNAAAKTRGGPPCPDSCRVRLRRLTGRATSRGGRSETGSSIWRTTATRRSRWRLAEFPFPAFCGNVLSWPQVTFCPLSLSDPVHGPDASGSQEVQGSTQVFQRPCEFRGRFRGVTSSYSKRNDPFSSYSSGINGYYTGSIYTQQKNPNLCPSKQ